jgi:2-dehydro-3-deoxygluconokinase
MMRLSTPGYARFAQVNSLNVLYAGSEANVASSISHFGISAAHVTRFPNNDLGQAATQSLQRDGVDTQFIIYGDERMGVYFLENGSMQRASRIIYDRFNSAFAHIKPGMLSWENILKDATWFHWTGITPAISQGAADVCLEAINVARKNNLTISGDINYRRNLWQYGKTASEIMPALIKSSDIIVAGITDMQNCAGISGDNYEAACASMKNSFPNLKKILTTERESISSSHNRLRGLMWNGQKLLQSKEYDLTHIVDRVGAGDAFMAGFIYATIKKMDDSSAIDFATAAGVFKHSVEGDVNVASAQEIETLVKGENIGKLLR